MFDGPFGETCDRCKGYGVDSFAPCSRACRESVRALVIDYDRVDAEALAGIAARSRQLRFDVTICASLEAAEAELLTGRFDIVFLDYWLGVQTAIPFLHAITSRRGPPCVVVTDLDEPDIRRIVFRAGAEAFLSKAGLAPQALESVVMTVLRARAPAALAAV